MEGIHTERACLRQPGSTIANSLPHRPAVLQQQLSESCQQKTKPPQPAARASCTVNPTAKHLKTGVNAKACKDRVGALFTGFTGVTPSGACFSAVRCFLLFCDRLGGAAERWKKNMRLFACGAGGRTLSSQTAAVICKTHLSLPSRLTCRRIEGSAAHLPQGQLGAHV